MWMGQPFGQSDLERERWMEQENRIKWMSQDAERNVWLRRCQVEQENRIKWDKERERKERERKEGNNQSKGGAR